jgi:acyl transferase domain-containing protein
MENNNALNEQNNFDIAVIGMAGRFPGARNIDEFWQNLRSGVESVKFFSDEELKKSGIDAAVLSDPNYVKAALSLDNPDMFDASFFGYSPREAEIMDPQHRIFLECAWEALENAGYDADRYDGPIGVYAGASMNTYLLLSNLAANLVNEMDLETLIGSDKDFLTTRVSYKINLKGPSITVQTACSTSLVAVHMACQSLLNEECDMALAGGVSIRVPQRAGYLYRQGGLASPDGHCRAFDAKGQGTIFGSGVGVVLLKRLVDAIADGDCIYAVIKGSAINNDGHTKVGYTAPSVDGQSTVIAEALANSDIKADTLSYIEAHGTATPLGDPIEIAALTKAFRNHTDKKGFCAIGSVKTNIGHLDAAAGITGLIKTVLALKHKMIPPTLHFEKANPNIDFQNSPFYVNTKLKEWKVDRIPRRAGVSSFGIGGTNAHAVLEEAPDIEPSKESRSWQLLLLSAKTSTALETATTNLADYLKHHPDLNLADVAYTLQVGRKAFNHRRIVVCQDRDDAVTTLEGQEPKRILTSFQEPENRDVVFMFSGQGSQYVNMGLELYRTEPVFREEVDCCCEILKPDLGLDLRDIFYPDESNVAEAEEQLLQTFITQPALFTIEYALARLWMAWGVHPVTMVGHSIGEYVAACLAGVFSLEDALSLVATRGRLIQELPGGSMMAVFLSPKEIEPLLGEKLSLAVINGPAICVVSGEKEAMEDLEKQLSEKKVYCRHLHTSHAFHSKMMDSILDAFAEKVKEVSLNAPQIPFVSNVTGTWITPDQAMDPSYWARHLRQPVRFSDDIAELLKEPNRVFLEVGPGCTFSTLVGQHPSKKEHIVLASTRHPKEKKSDVAFILNTLGQLWLAGIQIDWSGFYANESRHRLPLPAYPFERQRYWIEAGEKVHAAASIVTRRPKEELEEAARSKPARPEQKIKNAYNITSTDIEQTLANIWQDTLGVKQVNLNDNFFDLGGNSLMALRMFADIEKKFGRRLSIATLYKAPTIERLAGILRDGKYTASWESLVEIQSGGSKPPLFFVHAAGGNLLIYRNLVHHLGPGQPIYGLQAQGLDGERPFLTSIEDMAAQYVREIRTAQPKGPYLLAGYCMGGTIALEMAQQLYAQNQEVALLALMETYNFSNIPTASFDKIYYRIQQIEFHLRNLLLSDRKMVFLQEKAKVVWGRKDVWFGMILSKFGLDSRLKDKHFSVLSDIWKACDLAAINYVPKVYPGRITQFRPTKQYACFDNPESGWDQLTTRGLETCNLPVYPRGMLVEPFVKLLAEKMKDCISRALEKVSEPPPGNEMSSTSQQEKW